MKWNIRERVAELREGVVTVVCRHPLELLLLLALTVTLIVCVETGRDPDGARLVVMGWGAFVLLVVNRLTDRSREAVLEQAVEKFVGGTVLIQHEDRISKKV